MQGREIEFLAGEDFVLLRLIVAVLARIYGESQLHRTSVQVRLGKAKQKVSLPIADAGLDLQGFAKPEEVVGGVAQADEGSSKSADAALQADTVLSFFSNLQHKIDRACLFVEAALGDVLIVRLQAARSSPTG